MKQNSDDDYKDIIAIFQSLSDEVSIDSSSREQIKSEIQNNQLQLESNFSFFQNAMKVFKSKYVISAGSIFMLLIFLSLPFLTTNKSVEMENRTDNTYKTAQNEGESIANKPDVMKNVGNSSIEVNYNYPSNKQKQEDTLSRDRSQIRSGEFVIIVEDFSNKHAELIAEVERNGGYVLSSSINQDQESGSASYTLRIPVEKFDEFTQYLRTFGIKLVSESISLTDKQSELTQLNKVIAEKTSRINELNAKSNLTGEEKNELIILTQELEFAGNQKQVITQETEFATIIIDLDTKEHKSQNQFARAFDDVLDGIEQVIVFWIWLIVPLFFLTPFIVGVMIWKKRKSKSSSKV